MVFDEDDDVDGKGSKKGSVLLRNVVKVEDIEDPIAVGQSISESQIRLADTVGHGCSRGNHLQDRTRDSAEDI